MLRWVCRKSRINFWKICLSGKNLVLHHFLKKKNFPAETDFSNRFSIFGTLILGLGPDTLSTITPQRIDWTLLGGEPGGNNSFHTKICDISCGNEHVIVTLNIGRVFGWGKNHDGRLGNNTNRDFSYPFPIVLKENNVKTSCGIEGVPKYSYSPCYHRHQIRHIYSPKIL